MSNAAQLISPRADPRRPLARGSRRPGGTGAVSRRAALSRRFPLRSASAPRRRRRSPPRRWQQQRSGGSGRGARKPSVDMRARSGRVPQRAPHAPRRQSARPHLGQDRRRLSHRRRRTVRLHTNFPHHRDGMLKLLGCAYEREAVQAALVKWEGGAIRDGRRRRRAGRHHDALARRVGGASAGEARWRGLPLFEISKIGEAPARALPPAGERPLSGIRVLDLTRVIAGPVCGRTLAAHGADVMRITAPHLPGFRCWTPTRVAASSRPRSICAPRRTASGSAACCAEAHIFVQGYRPGGVASLGFSPEACAEMRPGIVAVSLSAYGHDGPWASRRGFDSLVQNASGINRRRGAKRPASPRAQGASRPGARSRHGLPHGVRGDDGAGPQGARGRVVARARVAGADGALADRARPTAEWLRLPDPPARRSPTSWTEWTRRRAA